MALSSIELWQRIAAEGLASPMQCRTWAADVAKSVQAADTTDGVKVLQALIELGRLSNYQAKILAGQSDRPLHRGAWTILNRVKQPLWEGWLAVTKVDLTKAEAPPATWARWLPADELQSLKSSAPSLPRGLQLASVHHENLQGVHVPELADSELQLQVDPVRGELLTEAFSGKPPEAEQTTSFIEQVANGLAAMHAANLVHGRVFPDRIYVAGDQVTLSRDPISVNTATLDESAVGILGEHLVGEHLQGLRGAQFLAPEFVAPGQLPTIASDVYALGCTWWWLLTGKPLVDGKTTQQILARHTEAKLELPNGSDYPEPLVRCLKHCLAKNLDARFNSAAELSHAITEALRVTAVGKVVQAMPSSPNGDPASPVKSKSEPQNLVRTQAESVEEIEVAKSTVEAEAKPVSPGPKGESSQTQPATKKAAGSSASPVTTGARDSQQRKLEPERSSGPPKSVGPAKSPVPKKPEAGPAKTAGKRKMVAAVVASDEPVAKVPNADADDTSTEARIVAPVAEAREPKAKAGSVTATISNGENGVELKDNKKEGSPASELPQKFSPATKPRTLAKPKRSQKSKPAASSPSKLKVTQESGAAKPPPTLASTSRGRRSRKRGNKWLLPVAGGCGFVIVMLLVLKLSGALEPSANKKVTGGGSAAYVPPASTGTGEIIQRNPLLDYFNIVDDDQQLWLPPSPPSPLELDMLPPGGQLFVSFKPATLMSGDRGRSLLAAFDEQLTPLLQLVAQRCGKPLETMRQVTIGFYSAESSGAFPQFAIRVELNQATPLSSLRSGWENPTKAKLNEQELLVNNNDLAYYVAEQPLVDAQSVSEFSVGPVSLMREVAEMAGGSGPLNSQMEALRKRTDRESDLSILFSPRYLFSEGRGLLDRGPERLRQLLTDILGNNTRAALLQTRLDPSWYLEAQIVGASDRDAPGLVADMQNKLNGAPEAVENWFVDESPHTYWRALALRYPQMLRTVSDFSRFSVEDGTAVVNLYLSPDAALNLTLASWIALQPSATVQSNPAAVAVVEAVKPLTIDEYLGRAIRLSFDQEPIEVALSLVGDEANADLPGSTPQLRFALDGDAFEKGGITRNQQLKDFNMNGKSVRDALTEIAKRGNTDRTVTDIRDAKQNLIWVVTEDPQAAGKKMVSLTTRVAANAAGIDLPVEFAPAPR